jgi:hypothetical protein
MKTRTQRPLSATQRDRTPALRSMTVIAPSGAGGWLTKVWPEPGEVGYGSGNLTPIEHNQFWKVKNLILRLGLAGWDQARAQLVAAGWTITDHP